MFTFSPNIELFNFRPNRLKIWLGFSVRIFERLGVQIFAQLAWFHVNKTPKRSNFRPVETSSATARVNVANTLETITSGVFKYKAFPVFRSSLLSRWLGALLIIVYMISVSVILLNILIAQLSLTYELVQEESLLSFTALRMQAVAIVEWHSRFKYWVRTSF